MNDKYGVKGSVHKLEQRRSWKYGLKHLPNDESFDIEFSPSGQALQITKYNGEETVIGSERFDYNDSGKIIRSLAFDSEGVEKHNTEFAYPSEESRVAVTRNSSGKVTSQVIEVYKESRLLSFAVFDGKNQRKREKTFQYLENRLFKSNSRFYLPDGSLYEQWMSSYDSEGRLAGTFGLKPDGEPLGDGKYSYEYDIEGRLARVWSFNDLGDDMLANGVKVYEYSSDSRGNWVERREFHQFRGDSEWSNRITTRNFTYYP
jgi:hypothetical protein